MAYNNNRLLLIEDDEGLARSICRFLEKKGFDVKHFVNGDDLDVLVASSDFAMIICDVMLPGTDGFEIAKKIRGKFSGSYVFLTSLDGLEHQLKGFELGADDYICKPVDPQLLLARVNACLNRKPVKMQKQKIQFTNLSIDNDAKAALVANKKLPLSNYEFDLLWLLASHCEQQLSREFLFTNTVGREYDGLDRTVDGRVSRLRKKLEQTEGIECEIHTSWGRGYMLVAKPI